MLARMRLKMRREPAALFGFMFHSLFADASEINSGLVDPFQPTTVDDFRDFIMYFQSQEYTFVSASQIIEGLDPKGRYVFVTFDDGYANNLRALPVVRELDVPITVFVSSNHVLECRAYWWDIHYRERMRQGIGLAVIAREREELKELPSVKITEQLVQWFGPDCQIPCSDIDRPLTSAELETLSKEPLVTIGNHTADHAIFTVLDEPEIVAQIRKCENDLQTITGKKPNVIAYPNGNYDDKITEICRSLGYKLGVSTIPRNTALPLDGNSRMSIGRFELSGGARMIDQCRVYQSGNRMYDRLRGVI